jgi:hypothetical protein
MPRFRGQSQPGVTAASAFVGFLIFFRGGDVGNYPAIRVTTYKSIRPHELIHREPNTRQSQKKREDVGMGLGSGHRRNGLLRTHHHHLPQPPYHLLTPCQGRAALVALRRSGGGAGPLGRSFYKGGFEPKMTRREAALILEMPCVHPPPFTSSRACPCANKCKQ